MCQTLLWRYMKDHGCSIVSFQNQKLVGMSFLLMLCCIIHCLGIRWLRILIMFGFGQIYWGRILHVELFRCWIEWIVLQVIFIWFCNFLDWYYIVSNGQLFRRRTKTIFKDILVGIFGIQSTAFIIYT